MQLRARSATFHEQLRVGRARITKGPEMTKTLLTIAFVAAFGCGFQPFPPFGCTGHAECVCDAAGHCQWIWRCR